MNESCFYKTLNLLYRDKSGREPVANFLDLRKKAMKQDKSGNFTLSTPSDQDKSNGIRNQSLLSKQNLYNNFLKSRQQLFENYIKNAQDLFRNYLKDVYNKIHKIH